MNGAFNWDIYKFGFRPLESFPPRHVSTFGRYDYLLGDIPSMVPKRCIEFLLRNLSIMLTEGDVSAGKKHPPDR